jgi:predicted ATPase/DNA-binding SARP family transcriptional activator
VVRVTLFGTPRVEREGQVIPQRRSKGLALLAFLAVTGVPHRRDTLLGLLWPEFDEASARNNLRRELSLLREALGTDAIAADRHEVAWHPHPDRPVDVVAFARQIAESRRHGHAAGICDVCGHALGEAVQLATGEFMAGFSLGDSAVFEEWLRAQREELHAQLEWALESLVGWRELRGEAQQALELARRWQALDPLHEAPRRALMRLHVRLGQPAAALRQYEDAARLLADELGAEPEPATTDLYNLIRTRALTPATPTHQSAVAHAPSAPWPAPDDPAPADDAPPPPLTTFIGRQREIADLTHRLTDPACRLITLIGPGGIGKTRLAAEIAALSRGRFADGAAVVPLAGVSTTAHIPGAVAAALRVTLAGSADLWRSLGEILRGREQLLVLDNLEQLPDAAPLLAGLLASAPRLKLLATSREALKLQEEWRYPLDGLAVPDEGAAGGDAVDLFVARALQVRPDFAPDAERGDVARICRLVGGMPLAIELAAAWAASLSCAEIAAEVAGGLAIFETSMRNTPARQRSVQAIFDQTWARLSQELRAALARLSIFAGGFTREAAAAVASATTPTLARLLDHALLRRDAAGRYRFHPLVRQYAAQRLRESQEAASAEAAYAAFYRRFLCEQYARQIAGEQRALIAAVGEERENISSAVPALLDEPPGEPLRQMLQVIEFFYFTRGPYQEGTAILGAAEERLRQARADPEARRVLAHVLIGLGHFATRRGAIADARAYFEESRATLADLGFPPSAGDASDPEIGLGVIALVEGDYVAARQYGAQVQARSETHGLAANLAYGWYLRAEAAQAQGLLEESEEAARRSLAAAQAAGAEWLSAYVYNQLGEIAASRGRYEEAARYFDAGFALREAFGDHEGMALALLSHGAMEARRGRHAEAAQRYARSLAMYRQIGDRGGAARSLLGLGATAVALGQREQAREQLQAALAVARELDYHHVVLDILTYIAELLLAEGRAVEASELLGLALHHPASRPDTAARARQSLGRSEDLLAPDAFAAAVERGRALGLDEALARLAPPVLTAQP